MAVAEIVGKANLGNGGGFLTGRRDTEKREKRKKKGRGTRKKEAEKKKRRNEQKVEGKKGHWRDILEEGVLVYLGQQTMRGERLLGVGREIF